MIVALVSLALPLVTVPPGNIDTPLALPMEPVALIVPKLTRLDAVLPPK
jgi:hypothetical protein